MRLSEIMEEKELQTTEKAVKAKKKMEPKKKKITNIASDLFLVSLMEGVNREVVCNSVHNVIKLIIRISHTEPGNVKGFYKKLNEDLNKEIKVVADELAKATKA